MALAPVVLVLGALLGRCPDSFHLRWEAARVGLPPLRVEAMARAESVCDTDPHLRGHLCWHRGLHLRSCEWGRFQIRPATASKRCHDLDIRTYAGNVQCYLRIFSENIERYGLTDATIHYNGALDYLRRVCKIEERLGVPPAVAADASSEDDDGHLSRDG